jgi:hypothetical protein
MTTHVGANDFNDAGELQTRNFLRVPGRRRIMATPLQRVSAVHSGCAHANEQFIAFGFRRRNLADLKYLRAACLNNT